MVIFYKSFYKISDFLNNKNLGIDKYNLIPQKNLEVDREKLAPGLTLLPIKIKLVIRYTE